MSPVERDIIERKLQIVIDSLRLLEPIASDKLDDYRRDVYRRKATERILQELVEALVDINVHILSRSAATVPDDMFTSFIALGDIGVLPQELARELAPSAGLRNRLVHEYDALDDSIVLRSAASAVARVPDYVAAIVSYLRSASG